MRSLIIAFLFMFPVYANADTKTGEIVGFIPFEVGAKKLFFVKLKDSTAEGCNITGRFAFDSSKVSFDIMVSALMAAHFSRTPVQIEYSKTCNVMGNSYDINYISVGSVN